jgi:hypothetical protein
MPRKALIIVLAVLVLGGVLSGVLYWRWYNSPRYALQQMALALKTRNMETFFKYLDMKAIFNNFLEASSRDQDPDLDPDTDEWTQMTRRLGRKFARFMLPQLFNTFESQIRGVLENYLLNLDNTQILGVAAAATTARIDARGDEALVTLTDPKTKEPLRFQMQRQANGGLWQIVAVNHQDLKRFYRRQFR